MNNCLVLSLGLVLISCSPLLANGRKLGEQSLVNQMCYDERCRNYAKVADPKIVNAKNYSELVEAVLQVGEEKAIEAQKFLKNLAQVEKNPAIERCANIYEDDVIGFFMGVLHEFKLKEQAASYSAGVGSDQIGYCNTELENAKINNPAITALNSHIRWYFHIAGQAIDKCYLTISLLSVGGGTH